MSINVGMNVPVLGERLRMERERLGLAQSAFAEACGVTSRSQRNYEAEERLPDAAYLAAAMKIGVDVPYVLVGIRSGRSSIPDLDPKEQVVLDAFRSGSAEQQEFILKAALGFAGTKKPAKLNQVFKGKVGQQVTTDKLDQRGISFFGGKKRK